MRHPFRSKPVLALPFALAVALAAPPAAAQTAAAPAAAPETIPVPDAIKTVNVPPILESEVADLAPYENLRSAGFNDWHPAERRMLITTRFAEVTQIHEVAMPGGARRQITFYDERVLGGSYRPGAPDQIGYAMDEGGAENYQVFVMDRESGEVRRLSDGVHRHQGVQFSNDGEKVAWVSNARNGRDFDLYVADPDKAGAERRVVELSGSWFPSDWSPDDEEILLVNYISINDSSLWVADVASGELTRLSPEPPAGQTVSYGGGSFSPDGRFVYTTSDLGSEFSRLVRLDRESGEWTTLSADVDWDVGGVDLSDDGTILAFVANEDGFSRIHVRSTADNRPLAAPELPLGVTSGVDFRPGSHEIGFTFTWARSSADAYSWDVDAKKLTRWTESEMGGIAPERFAEPELVRYPTFDEVSPGVRRTIPAFVYKPDPAKHQPPWPVYVDIHGGPEGQERPGFLGSDNFLPDELGVALVHPNVRGSSGYGKSYLKLDNAELREDSVKDIGALLDWIATQPDLDASRVMVGGGSYGGYMSLASMVFYDERLCCGFDYVGISSFVTFLENTSDYRRDLRRAEYGDESDPEMRKLLERISPLTRIDDIDKPMLVAQGANDPRVPLSESDQVVAALAENGTPVWYLVAADEGHGFAKKSNSDYLRAVFIEFVRTHLLAPKAPAVETGVGAGD
ncbi:MAG TPA: prolyl oligopeptidase family serine peptidase [Thermoanaerobaculia bacterium]|nr:prolyl oligopeptidase family serine peptidase [Thermoanaerobaculia bacterium]